MVLFSLNFLPDFRVSYSFGMISGCVRNDIGMFFDEKEGRETYLQVYPRDR